MDWSQFFAVFITFSILLLISQRMSRRHQGTFRIFIIIFAIGWMSMRLNLFFWEMIFGILASLVFGFIFWLLIGRYNPVGDEDETAIKVYGLDD